VTSADVTIVGAGPVGLLLALLLGRSGWRVVVVERQGQPYGRPRAVHIDHEVARILQSAGVMAELAPLTEVMDAYEWRNAAGATLLRLGVEGTLGISGWPSSLMFAQPDLERILETALGRLANVELRRGWDVTGVEVDGNRATVRTDHDQPPQPGTAVESRWLVGCDGAGSIVRTASRTPFTDLGYAFDWLVVDVRPAEARPWRPLNLQVCDPARPTTAVSGGPGRRRFEFMRLPGDAPLTFNRPETAWRLLEPWGYTPANATLERHATYTFTAGLVERWRHGPVLLAGDAAHQMPPFAGQGLCSGLRDAANLAWKLDLVLAGRAADELLDTYGGERATQVRSEIDFSVDLGQIICILDPAEAAARDEGMITAARDSGPIEIPPGPPLGPGVTLAGDPNAGQLALQAVVGFRGRRGRFDDVVGGGWTLLGGRSDPGEQLVGPQAAWWEAIGGRSWPVGPGALVDDEAGRYGGWLDGLGAAVVLVRPDFYVFGTSSRADGGPELVAALQERLGPRNG
jgi:2-polyprenyl-6-methoxyphenol hydroxylase-like FAD-dependent oxidoreductase